ncbi:Zinc finger protein 839 [Frankliniella fusca]|uniref:Zinc finger protein 839 n=1 Tax=Frankliniella fusca TaxID=407009 RepID=A0AAE1H530_9NEOP|nr:Zinc finger protein 839 [Frankliniella fusca]
MATENECAEATQVLLVDPQSLPVLLQGDSEGNADISVDLLQQALQGTSAIDDANDEESGEEVSLDALAGSNNDVVAIYQGEEGQTHTIKISMAEAQSLGLQFTNDNYPLSLSNGSLLSGVKVVSNQLDDNNSDGISNTSLLQSVACSNVSADGRIIDEEGNIVETTASLQILPTTLSSFLDDGMNQSLSIIPQYELDGTVTYAVKLKDQNDTVLGTDYHILEPDTSAKTGLDIEEELKTSSLKQSMLRSGDSISTDSMGLAASVSLNSDTSSATSTIQVPISTLEALSKQMLLPATSSSVPISMTLSIPSQTSVPSHPPVSSSTSLATSNANRFFQIVSDHSSVGLNNVIAADTSVPLSTIVSQPALNVTHQHLISQSANMMNVQSSPALTILGNHSSGTINQNSRPHISSEKLQPILPLLKNHQGTPLKTVTALRKVPIPAKAIAPSAIMTSSVNSPAMASVAPQTCQPNFSGASSLKSMQLSNARVSVSGSNSSKPLGSSENPIQLVQQGQTFHSMQALSQAQLRQIATVLQQKHLNSNSVTSKNVLFDEQTKTRIVYRVVYPEDVDLQQPSSPTEISGGPASHSSKTANRLKGKRGRPKIGRRTKPLVMEKHNHKSAPVSAPTDTSNSLITDGKKSSSREENAQPEEVPKVEKKKVLGSRTRSGRVSRPPKHMMRDYKRLHHTDFRERDGDDSDGGYSDYSNPDQAPEKPPLKEVEMNLSPVKKKISRFSCPTCEKLYLGVGRMEKHFLQHPDHGSFEEFKQNLAASNAADVTAGEESVGEKEAKSQSVKGNSLKGKKRTQGFFQSEKERSEARKKRLKQALEACEISEVLEIAGPLIARYYSLWELLLLRLSSKEEPNLKENSSVFHDNQKNTLKVSVESLNSQEFRTEDKHDDFLRQNCDSDQNILSNNNRAQWLLMELASLADTLKSVAGDLFQPALIHDDEKTHVKINQKDISEFLGLRCGMYSVHEEHLCRRMESITGISKKTERNENEDLPPEKKSRNLDEPSEFNINLPHEASVCPETLSSLSLMVKTGDDKVMLTEDMPFLNSSDDMICGSEDPDLSTDSKRDCDPAAGLQVVDDIVNERLKNLSDNMNFSVPLQDELEPSTLNGQDTDLHLMSGYEAAGNSISVSNSSVISNNLTESSKASESVSNMDLISSYSMPSLTRPTAHDVNISNSSPSNDLSSALEPVSSQGMLGNFGIGLPSLTSFDPLQSQNSTVSHSEDSFLESLSSFEAPLTQSCNNSNTAGSTFDDDVMKSNGLLQLANEPTPEPSHIPPKFISSFTPAITNEKSTTNISTAQRLQRTYLELDSGLDVGLDLDFEDFTQQLNMNQNSNT